MKQTATLSEWVMRRMIPRCKSNVRNFLTMLFLLSGMIFVTQKSDAQCNSFGIDFKQGANRDNFGSYTTGEIHWINSILQQSNSRYIEGMSTLQRVVFNNLPACSGTHTLRIKLEARKGDVHAYDFLTSWDNALKAAAAIAPGFGLMPSSRSDPKLHECGPAIDACAEVACILVSGGDGVATATDDFRDLPIIFSDYASPTGAGEKNLLIDDGTAVDQNTTRQAIQTYECRYGDNIVIPSGVNAGTYDRSVRVYVDGGFTGANGDANNAVYFVGYGDANPNDGGDTYIYYDIVWSSTSTSVVLEFAAHIAVGVDGLAANNPGGCNVTPLGVGYLLNRGASSISGGPYHVIIEDFIGPDGTSGSACEPNLGNQDNQLQGSEILLIPACNLQGPSAVCANTTATYTATVTNPDNATNAANATYLWEIINSSQSPPAATINPPASGNVPQIVGGQTSTSLSITVNTGGVGTYTVKLTITNGAATSTTDDDITSSCTVTTTVSGGATITCPQNTTVASCSASDITTAFNNWLNSVSGVTGGTATRNPANPVAPGICGGTTSVTWTVTNTCGNQSCTSSFTVSTPSAVILTCAQNTTIAPCTSQGAINTAYANWLASATATGGCNRGSVTNSGGAAPDACAGGTRTVTFTVTSTCETKTCSASFTVLPAPAVVLTCAANTTVAAGQAQGAVDGQYATWLLTATATGGCSRGSVTNNGGSAPPACGGTKTVTFTVTSACETKTCSASFTVLAQTAVTLNCPQNTTVSSCSTSDINTAFTNWLASVQSSGGTLTRNPTSPSAPGVCGGATTVTWTVTNTCFSQSCSATFTVATPSAVVLTCAQNTTVTSCSQSDINTAYSNWLASATATGGCNRGSVTNSGGAAPDACAGGTRTVTFTVTSTCETKTCSASFTVTAAPALVLTCAQNTTIAACTSQGAVNTAYANWLASATATGGCNRGSVTNSDGGAPDACAGGTRTVTFTVTSTCETKTCSASFTVNPAPAVVLTCAVNTTANSCQTQDQVNTAYANWLASATATGGCNRGSVTNSGGAAPDACAGGTRTVTFTVTSTCETKTCSASFTVTAAPALVLTCAQNTTIAACTSQGAINTAYTNWLASATATGGCNRGSVTNSDGGAPDACAGGTRTVTFTVTSTCETKTCSASFTVNPAPAVVLNCAVNTTVAACTSQAGVNTAYSNWLASASATGGCARGNVTNSGGAAPNACSGGTRTVTFTVTSSCETKTCAASFTVIGDNTPPVITCAANTTVACGTANPTFATPGATDACGTPTVTQLGSDVVAGSCPTTYTRRWIATDACGNTSTCSQTITVPCCSSNCTYTQGYYGQDNDQGNSCDGTTNANNQYGSPTALIDHALLAYGGLLRIGCVGHSVTISTGEAQCVRDMLPGGGNNFVPLSAGDYSICALPDSYIGNNGRINNPLLAQTITLGLNLGINPSGGLGNFALQVNKWLVTADLVECGSTTVKPCTFNCTPNLAIPGQYIWTVATSPYHVTDCRISQALYDALPTKNVAGLYAFANSALCGTALPTGVTLQDISKAVDCINNAFDGCRAFVEWRSGTQPTANSFCTLPSATTPCPITPPARITTVAVAEVSAEQLTVNAYPNPFTDRVRFVVRSKVSGQGSLEIYNMLGQKIETVYNGNIVAERSQTIEYRTSTKLNGGLIYIFRVGDKQATGKLLKIEQ